MQENEIPLVKIRQTRDFSKSLKRLNKKYRAVRNDIKPLINRLEAGDIPGDRISGNKYPVYKVRVINSDNNRGQSGGYRVIYYTITLESVLLTTIYSKSEQDTISNDEIERIISNYELEGEEEL